MATLYGTTSPDSLIGGWGADRIFGWDQAASWSDPGPDTDADTLLGLDGPDYLAGGNGRDLLIGGGFHDVLDGGDGADRLLGGAGNDTLYADLSDRALGGDGDDVISVESYPDGAGLEAEGGAGNDRVQVWGLIAGEVSGGTGIDRLELDLHDGTTGLQLDLSDPSLVQVLGGALSVSGFEALSLDLDGAAGADRITGGLFDDLIIGGGGRDRLRGMAGQDTLGASGDAATLLGGAGDDDIGHWGNGGLGLSVLLDGGEGQDILRLSRDGMALGLALSLADPAQVQTLADGTRLLGFERLEVEGGTGADTITGGALDDSVMGGSGDDLLNGGAGNDVLSGGGGLNQVEGGAGNDTLSGDGTLSGGEGDDLFSVELPQPGNHVLGGAGIDTLDYDAYFAATGIALDLTDPTQPQTTSEGVTLVDVERVDFHGGAQADTVTGGDGADTLAGGGGSDRLRGGGGDDLFILAQDEGADRISGNGGIDRLIYSANWNTAEAISLADPTQAQTLSGGATVQLIEVLEFWGGEAADTITGGAFDDQIRAGGGANVLHGGAGNDMLDNSGAARAWGGAGADTLVGLTGQDAHYDGGADTDLLQLSWGDGDLALTLSFADPAAVQTLADGTVITGFEAAELWLGRGADHATGGALDDWFHSEGGDDTILGGGGNDTVIAFSGDLRLSGGAGNDVLQAGSGRDVLRGDEGHDRLMGEAGADRLIGGAGSDYLDGGLGADRFRFDQEPLPPDVDYLVFHAGQGDVIELLGSAFAALPPGALDASAFVAGRQAGDADDRLLWDAAQGRLYFDADGLGGQRKQLFLILDADGGLQASDFLVV